MSPGWHQRACLSLLSVLSLPGSGDPNTPHAHFLIHYVPSSHATSTLLREIVTGGGSEAGIEGNHGGVGGGRQRLRDGSRGSVLLYFTLESSINNAKSKRLQVSGSGLWDIQQPIRLPPPQSMSSWLLPTALPPFSQTEAPRELVFCGQCPKPVTSLSPENDAQMPRPNKIQQQGQTALALLRLGHIF